MNFNPFRRKNPEATANQGGQLAVAARNAEVMGPWGGLLGQWQPRATTPWLFEALREAIPVLDAVINRLVTVDGIIEVEGDNKKLVAEIRKWMSTVPVNDVETGFQAFYASQGAEHYEQGVGIGEFIYAEDGRDVVGLRVADGKGIAFFRDTDRMRVFYRASKPTMDTRPDGLGSVEALLRGSVRATPDIGSALSAHGYVELDPTQLSIAVNQPEADNPYGTSVLRSVPFVAQILLKMQNATGRAWERFGDPSFHVHYGTKNRKIDADAALKRATNIVRDLGKALAAKATGNSVDLATGAGADDEVKIDVIGALGIALEIEMPARHMLEQVVAASGLPPWMLGITWSQAAGIGEQQSVVVLQESETRFERRRPGLERIIAAMLRARGLTWSEGDWRLVQRLPNLMDVQKKAQAEFLQAQTALMLRERGQPVPPKPTDGIDNNLRSSPRAPRTRAPKAIKAATEDEEEGEPWAEPDPELPKIEASTIAAMLLAWHVLGDDVLQALGLTRPAGDAFEFDPDLMPRMIVLGDATTVEIASQLLSGQTAAFDRGVANVGLELSTDFDNPEVVAAIERMNERMHAFYREQGLTLVRGGIGRRYREDIVATLASGAYDGMNPVNVAAALEERFVAGDYNWERLARSEIAMAQAEGKLGLMEEQGVETYDYETVGDALVSDTCNALAAAGPYPVNDPSSPIPVRDSHPNCRCTVVPRT